MFENLKEMQSRVADRAMMSLFDDAGRADAFSVTADGLLFDYSKTNIDDQTRAALLDLVRQTGVEAKRDAMFAGEKINLTEDRAVLHTALRNLDGGPVTVDGADVMPGVRDVLARMEAFAEQVIAGTWPETGKITDVVNIGIGGSDLGPAMAAIALKPFAKGPRCHFISNVDGADLADTLAGLDAATTLFIVASKTFTTQETMMNARSALAWAEARSSDAISRFVAISTAEDETAKFGIPPERVFGFEDWVGGRYSMWGPIGLSLMLAIGPEGFRDFLRGGQAMDRHFRSAPIDQNIPVLLALTGVWHHQVCGYATRAVLPYEQRLLRLPAYLQQLEMESNGKRVTRAGDALDCVSGPVVWGEPGTNGQHAFYQLIHQGTADIPCEFLVGAKGHEPELAAHHAALVANCLAQSEALLKGRSEAEARGQLEAKGVTGDRLTMLARHRVFPGNRPSTTLVYPSLTPFVLGQIIALYEHRVFVEGAILDINSYDQWGVELGKELANSFLPAVEGADLPQGTSGSTSKVLEFIRKNG
ncbi:glucose-6-phosphate isomerase [Shimia biformata]|uniref:glucose-6-phosphate isomerase n=1 Tax=Shimia biformata TaxID=1294299 RepID=UPI001950A476|nr:glucose-6-phosphate isomerase [Shimia biformata]